MRPMLLVAQCLALGTVSLGCWQQRVWSHAGEFVGRLRCAMSQSNVELVAKTYPGLKLEVTEPSSLVFWKAAR